VGVTSGELNEVVWGNQNTIDRRLSSFGDTKDLTEWFAYLKEVTP
jgi:hypothetical protein